MQSAQIILLSTEIHGCTIEANTDLFNFSLYQHQALLLPAMMECYLWQGRMQQGLCSFVEFRGAVNFAALEKLCPALNIMPSSVPLFLPQLRTVQFYVHLPHMN
ncbi:Hypothetical predicted protein [Xyrichtys novacula]|uniref:Uncharacterized protein n=1 Tax=Xyrichtys novacula TaxID=13765 RepID=A0AAV1F9W5_XYRNO|nr:Hypothetical predicted protein [Xyrichtys novacula]